jgi:ribosomal protein L11 methyltransferase
VDLIEAKIEIPVASVEAIDSLLLESGLDRWALMEDVTAKCAFLVGIFESRTEAEEFWSKLVSVLPPGFDVTPDFRAMAEAEWRDSYKTHFKAWNFGRLHWVPAWERGTFRLPAGHEVLWLDPGLAFGTGNHETTRLCAERLVGIEKDRRLVGRTVSGLSMIDAGCGSGILALSAAKLGFGHIVGFDNDPEAVRASVENALLNDAGERTEFFIGDLVSGLAGRTADIVCANILADVLIRHRVHLLESVLPGGCLILSGILATEIDAVRAAFRELVPDWSVDFRAMGEWCDLVLSRPLNLGS